jgi:poly(hydroxyalkanoate) depolymerase family esterase
MNHTLRDMIRQATRLTVAGRLNEATKAIQRALSGAAGASAVPSDTPAREESTPIGEIAVVTPEALPPVPEGLAFEEGARAPVAARTVVGPTPAPWPLAPKLLAHKPHAQPRLRQDDADADLGDFTQGTHTHASLTRRYKLYVPPGHVDRQLPLIVMLHGCTQDPDDFAAGTGMNERAREQGFFVLYPAQSQEANPSRCWNWFKHNHQRRDSGEPALLAAMTKAVMRQYGIDAGRVYIAGLSAGGAMAAIVAAAYPEIYAAVGVHSGLPHGAASNVSEALAVMKSGVAGAGVHAKARRTGWGSTAAPQPPRRVPTIVFHGDQDQTVHPRNGEEVIAAALRSGPGPGQSRAFPTDSPLVEHGTSAQGRRYTRSTHHGVKGSALAEHWLVHGAGHAWSGGRAGGSYTDAKGPDATSEMLRFFFQHGLDH